MGLPHPYTMQPHLGIFWVAIGGGSLVGGGQECCSTPSDARGSPDTESEPAPSVRISEKLWYRPRFKSRLWHVLAVKTI